MAYTTSLETPRRRFIKSAMTLLSVPFICPIRPELLGQSPKKTTLSFVAGNRVGSPLRAVSANLNNYYRPLNIASQAIETSSPGA
jgi:hypothetical protein